MTKFLDEKHELLQLLKEKWDEGDSSLRRIYPSWEDLESNLEIKFEPHHLHPCTEQKNCPYCGISTKVKKPVDELFPYDECKSCKHTFHVSNDFKVRKLTEVEIESMPAEWVRIFHVLDKKKLAIVFKLE